MKDLENKRALIEQNLQNNKKRQQNKIFNNIDIDNETQQINNIANIDPKKLYAPLPIFAENAGLIKKQNNDDERENSIIKRNNDKILIKKYIDINSADRNWVIDKYRFRYHVNFLTNNNDIQSRYRNIESIRVEKVIIPQDTVSGNFDNSNNSSQPYRPFTYQFTLNLPFIYLIIDEFSDVYDGTNDTIRRCFSKLIIDKKYTTLENGRTYTILKPASLLGDEKIFFPAPLSTLNRLSISLMKPNGNLINNSHDQYFIDNISYDTNFPNYLAITLTNYFDTNEFNTNDLIIIKQYNMTLLNNTQNSTDIVIFNSFINNVDGHCVVDIAGKNSNNFYNLIYIMAPYTFDGVNGQNILQNNLISVLNNYNSNTTPPSSGLLMNYSLQNSISFTIKTVNDDSSIINEQL